ncbi:hypothetical protein [Paenibacillus kribbensis]|uniref:hypothetical protein n=1 Tax=Paenibacillus kribbensis TaxID=172713 RepID=UPI0008380211|nr:hypothetical protein [Paenibacillus kribbensis]
MSAKDALIRFFDEKELEPQTFSIEHNETVHFVDLEYLKDIIINHASVQEQRTIRGVIAQIDFRNGDMTDYLKHLAEAFVKFNF